MACRIWRRTVIGALIAEHGYSCYGGNSHIIADPDEAWVVLQYPGGLRLWVAERLGPGSIRASRPGYITAIPTQPDAEHLLRSLEALLRVGGKLNLDSSGYRGPAQVW